MDEEKNNQNPSNNLEKERKTAARLIIISLAILFCFCGLLYVFGGRYIKSAFGTRGINGIYTTDGLYTKTLEYDEEFTVYVYAALTGTEYKTDPYMLFWWCEGNPGWGTSIPGTVHNVSYKENGKDTSVYDTGFSIPTNWYGTKTYYARFRHGKSSANYYDGSSKAITITRKPLYNPTITEQPKATSSVYKDQQVDLTVKATNMHGGAITYQWYNTTSATDKNGTEIKDQTKDTLTLANATAGIFYYYVIVTSHYKEERIDSLASEISKVSVSEKEKPMSQMPDIEKQPASIDTIQFQKIDLEVVAKGSYKRLTYQWYINTKDSNTGGKAIEGAITSKISITCDNIGKFYYYVELTNSDGDDYKPSIKVSQVALVQVYDNEGDGTTGGGDTSGGGDTNPGGGDSSGGGDTIGGGDSSDGGDSGDIVFPDQPSGGGNTSTSATEKSSVFGSKTVIFLVVIVGSIVVIYLAFVVLKKMNGSKGPSIERSKYSAKGGNTSGFGKTSSTGRPGSTNRSNLSSRTGTNTFNTTTKPSASDKKDMKNTFKKRK